MYVDVAWENSNSSGGNNILLLPITIQDPSIQEVTITIFLLGKGIMLSNYTKLIGTSIQI